MAWRRRMGGIAGPLSASGEASNGNPVQVELYINGEWIDITSYVMVRDNSGNIKIARGRRDEGSGTEQSSCQLILNNRDGRWSPRNPTGIYYGHIGRNQPVRVSVPNGLGGKSYRFQGEISIWPQSWDPTGTDVWSEVEGSGIMRRLAQGPVRDISLIREAIPRVAGTALLAYWPCEDAAEATSIATAVTNGSPMEFYGTPQLATYDRFGSSDPVPTLTESAIVGGVTRYDATTSTAAQMRHLLAIPVDGIPDTDVVSRMKFLDSDVMVYLDVIFNDPPGGLGSYGNAGTLSVIARDGDQAEIGGGTQNLTMDVRGRQLLAAVEISNNGADLAVTLRVLDLLTGDTDSADLTVGGASVSRVTEIHMAPETLSSAAGADEMAVGHVYLQSAVTPITDLGRSVQPNGEPAGQRISRVCGEEGIAFESVGDLDDTVTMGGQDRLNPLGLMQEAESADDGMLYESMPMLGLGYRTRESLCNQDAQLTLDYEGFNLSEVPTPVEDDRYIQNRVTITVRGVAATYSMTEGPLSTAQPPTGVGVYGTDLTLHLEDTTAGEDHAAWRVHLGTVDEPRYPQISVNLSHSSFISNPALKQAVLGLKQGDRILVQNVPSWLPPGDIDQIILGFEETITHFEHLLTFTCAPASPYTVGFADTPLARVDTDGSELVSAVASGATSFVVKPSLGQTGLWTTDTADFPFDIRLGGEIVTVTNITDWLSDTFTRVTANGWGTPDIGSAWSIVGGGVASDYATNGTVALHTLSTVDVTRRSSVVAVSPDFDIYCDITTSALATGDSMYGAVCARMSSASNLIMCRLEFTIANTIVMTIRKIVSDVQSNVASMTLTNTHVAGTFIRVRFQGIGSSFKAKAWAATDPEPSAWMLTGTDSSHTAAEQIGTRSIRVPANSNLATVSVQYDNFRVITPQTFTVTRSVNGIVKAQAAGEDIRLAYPTILSL
jgi:hypothetical protein